MEPDMETRISSFEIGDELQPESLTITLDRMKAYENWPEEKNVHCDEEFAKSVGFDQPICRAMMFSVALDKMLYKSFGPTCLKGNKLQLKYLKMMLPGDTCVARGAITGKAQKPGRTAYALEVWLENQDQEKLAAGAAQVEI